MRVLIVFLVFCLSFGGYEPSVRAAGFDCAKASAPIEVLICSDLEIDVLDTQMSNAYRTSRAAAREVGDEDLRSQIRTAQIVWNKRRNVKCGVPKRGTLTVEVALAARGCLVSLYEARLAELNRIIASFQEPEGFDATEIWAHLSGHAWSMGDCFDDQRVLIFNRQQELLVERFGAASLSFAPLVILEGAAVQTFELVAEGGGYAVTMLVSTDRPDGLRILERFEEGVVDDPMVGSVLRACAALSERREKPQEPEGSAPFAYGDPLAYLQGKWAFTADGCDGDWKTVFIGEEIYEEWKGKPAFGPPKPYSLRLDGFRIAVETGDFWGKELASSQFVYVPQTPDLMILGYSWLNLSSGAQIDTDQRMLRRCN